MAMDDLSWPRNPHPQRADGVAVRYRWIAAWRATSTTQPPAFRSVHTMQPLPGHRGAHGTRRPRHRPRKEKCKGVFRTTTAPDKAGLSPIPRPTGSEAGAGAPTLVAQDDSRTPAAMRAPKTIQTAGQTVVDGIGASLGAAPTTSAQSDGLIPVGPLYLESEIPDSHATQSLTPTQADLASAQRPILTLYALALVWSLLHPQGWLIRPLRKG
ncbi:hypothetical protein ZWY2020_035961 [Hordeum vulgare]|nr:hypothetical protein ZWY2020_035961 [Hordeum vulgare]